MALSMQGRPATAWVATLSLSLLLPACGGGGDPVDAGGTTARVVPTPAAVITPMPFDASPAAGPTQVAAPLLPANPEVVDSTRAGQRLIKAVGALDDGGHVVVWMSRDPQDTESAWPLWSQRFDAQGRKVGSPCRLQYLPEVNHPSDVAVTVLPEGRIGVTFVTQRAEDAAFAISEIHHWPFNLEGGIDGMVRVLDAVRFARFSPRFDTLAGPVTAVAARDGSHYVAWRYRIVGAAPLAPSVRAQRLAADGEPLGWIQRLDGEGGARVFGVQVAALDEGGWIVGEERVSSAGVRHTTFTQLDVARPLEIPRDFAHASDAFMLDLRGHGSVLFTRSVDPQTGESGAPQRIGFDTRGRAQPAREFARMPGFAVALRGGDYLTFEPRQGAFVVQRFTPGGDPVGSAFEAAGQAGPVLTAGLRRAGAVLAWVATTPEGEVQVLSQRLVPAPRP